MSSAALEDTLPLAAAAAASQNIEAAKKAGQDDAAAFMEKVKNATAKFLVTGA
jgi:hypothetical protein